MTTRSVAATVLVMLVTGVVLYLVYGVRDAAAYSLRQWIGFAMLLLGALLTYLTDFLQRKIPKERRNLWWKLPGGILALGGACMVFI